MARLKPALAALAVALIAGPAGAQPAPLSVRRSIADCARQEGDPRARTSRVRCRSEGCTRGRHGVCAWRCTVHGVVFHGGYGWCMWSRDDNPTRSR